MKNEKNAQSEKSKQIAEIKKILKESVKDVYEIGFAQDPTLQNALEKKEYNNRLYGPHRGSQNFLRMNKLPLFKLFHEEYFTFGKYSTYKQLVRESFSSSEIFDSIAVFAFAIAYDFELENASTLRRFIFSKAIRFWQRRALLTVWEGKQKEEIFYSKLREALPLAFTVEKTSEEQDKKYMTDFVILDENDRVKLGISLKSESYRWNKEHKTSEWLHSKENYETRGRELFKQDFGADSIIAISSIKDQELVDEEVDGVLYYLEHGKKMGVPEIVLAKEQPWEVRDFEYIEF